MSYEDYFKDIGQNLTLEEKIAIIKDNISSAAALTKEIKEHKKSNINNSENTPKNYVEVISSTNVDSFGSLDQEFKNLYNKISMLDISELKDEEISSKLKKLLGDNTSFINISRIKLLLYKEGIIYSKMLLDAKSKEEISELQNLIASLKTKIEFLDEEEELEEEETLEDDNKENNIFFLLSNKDNIIALESLRKNVPKDYYQAFKKLIIGLKTGKLKGMKRLHRQGYFELKDFKIRIIFDKLSDGNYIILDAFMKKFDTSLFYRNILAGRRREYEAKKEMYLSKHTNPEFIKEHEGYLAELIALLDSKTLEEGDRNEARTI